MFGNEFDGLYRVFFFDRADGEICEIRIGTKEHPFLGHVLPTYVFSNEGDARNAVAMVKDVLSVVDTFIDQCDYEVEETILDGELSPKVYDLRRDILKKARCRVDE